MLRSRSLALCLAGTLLVVGGCADVPSAPAGLPLELIASGGGPSLSLGGASVTSAVIGSRGGEIATASGHRLVFPAGAVAQPTEIRMRDDGSFLGVRLEPHGLQFPAGRGPVLTLRHFGAAAGYDVLRVVYVGGAGEILEVLPTRTGEDAVIADLRHFSGYLIAGGRQQ